MVSAKPTMVMPTATAARLLRSSACILMCARLNGGRPPGTSPMVLMPYFSRPNIDTAAVARSTANNRAGQLGDHLRETSSTASTTMENISVGLWI